MTLTAVALACALGWLLAVANGANDVPKGVATIVGAGDLDAHRAVRWATAWTVLGVVLGAVVATEMIATLGKGLLAHGAHISGWAGIAMLLGASAWVLLATRMGWPVSTTHAIVGAVVGVVWAHLGPGALRWDALGLKVAAPLLLSPLVAFAAVWTWLRVRAPSAGPDCLCVDASPRPILTGGSAAAPAATVRIETGAATECATAYPTALRVTWRQLHLGSAALVSFARGLNDGPKIVALTLAATASAAGAGRTTLLATVAVGGRSNLSAGVLRALCVSIGGFHRARRVVEWNYANTHKPLVGRAELAHVSVVGTGCPVTKHRVGLRTRMERQHHTVRGEHELLLEAEHVQRDRPVVAVERAETLDFFRLCNQLVAERNLGLDVFRRVFRPVGDNGGDFFVSDQRRGVAHRRNLVPDGRVGVVDQEVRQLHDVTVSVIERPIRWCVGHARTVLLRRAGRRVARWRCGGNIGDRCHVSTSRLPVRSPGVRGRGR